MANKKDNKKNRKGGIWIWIILIAMIIIAIVVASIFMKGSVDHWSAPEFLANARGGYTISNVSEQTSGNISILNGTWSDGSGLHKFTVSFDRDTEVGKDILAFVGSDFDSVGGITGSTTGAILSSVIPMVIMIIFYIFLFWMLFKSTGGAGAGGQNGIFGMSKNKARLTKSDVKFSDVAGISEEKSEVVELVDYLKNPTKYKEVGARAPKGILLEGPPGTGKTLLAKAVAGEAGVNFYSISGSEFDEMFVGLGASRIRELFNDAKKNAPCIIFIDEIDAVGRKRTSSMTGSNDQTLNQLLVEMDGFGTNSGVIVMAATNRSDVLDPALLRPGRFDRVIKVSLPDIKEREQILRLHAKNKRIDKTIDWYRIAQRTPGFSGAQLENVLNEAAILMIRENKDIIGINEIDEAIDRVIGGPAKKSRAMTMNDKKIVSYHESGHALIGLKLDSASKVQKVTIIPRGDAGGYTIMTPKDETLFQNRTDLIASITGYMGGRAAEAVIFGEANVTTGAHDDLDKATRIARSMVVQLGMSDTVGMTRWLTDEDISYGRSAGVYSQKTAALIDQEVSTILDEAYKNAKKIIKANLKELDLLAESLKIMETITAEQIEYIDKNLDLPDEVKTEKVKYDQEEEKIKKGEIIDIDLDDAEKAEEKAEVSTKKKTTTKKPTAKKTTTKPVDKKPTAKKKPTTTKKPSTKKPEEDKKDDSDKK